MKNHTRQGTPEEQEPKGTAPAAGLEPIHPDLRPGPNPAVVDRLQEDAATLRELGARAAEGERLTLPYWIRQGLREWYGWEAPAATEEEAAAHGLEEAPEGDDEPAELRRVRYADEFAAGLAERLVTLYLEETGLDTTRALDAWGLAAGGPPVSYTRGLTEAEHDADALLGLESLLTGRRRGPATLDQLSAADRARALELAAALLGAGKPDPYELEPEELHAWAEEHAAEVAEARELTKRARWTTDSIRERLTATLTPEGAATPAPTLQEWAHARGMGVFVRRASVAAGWRAVERAQRALEEERQKREEAERRTEELERKLKEAERARRTPPVIRMGYAGYNAHTRTPRMVEDAIRRKAVKLTAAEAATLRSWTPKALPLNARRVFLGCMGLLTQSGLMPQLNGKRPPEADPTKYVPVPVPGGYAQLADACGFERTEAGEYGPKHSSESIRAVQEGIEQLLQPQTLIHFWEEYDNRRKRTVTLYRQHRAGLIWKLSEGTVERHAGPQRDLFLSPHAQFIGLHPWALMDAHTHYRDLPGDVLIRYRDALRALGAEAKENKRLRAIIGTRPRFTEVDLEFLLWCYMHDNRRSLTIEAGKLADRVGLGAYFTKKTEGGLGKPAEGRKKLERAAEVAKRVGAIEGAAPGKDGLWTFTFPRREEAALEEPAGLEGGTLPLLPG